MSARVPLRRWMQRFFGRLLALTVILLLATSVFLYSARLPDGIVSTMVRMHVVLGYALCAILPLFFAPHLLIHLPHPNRRAKGVGVGLLTLVVAGCVCGVWLAWVGKSRDTLWLVHLHEIVFVGAIVAYLGHRLVALATPVFRYELAAVSVALTVAATLWTVNHLDVRSGKTPMLAKTDEPSRSTKADFGISRVRTVSGHWMNKDDLTRSDYCAQCHTEIAAMWEGSAHRVSSQNDPFYAATFASLQRARGPREAKFCGGCHDQAIFLTGHMEEFVDINSVNSTTGISCLVCHGIVEIPDRVGNAGYTIDRVDHYPFYLSDDPDEQEQNRRLIRSKPEKHKASLLKPLHKSPELCLSCHKVHLPEGLNRYRWKRGQNDFDSWHDSSIARLSALTYFNAPEAKNCNDCHMPLVPTKDPAAKNGMSPDHSFAAANTALAAITGNAEWMRKAEATLKDCLKLDIFSAVVHADTPDSRRIWPLERPDARVQAGDKVQVEVVVHNDKVGHIYPAGTTDLNETWLEFTIADLENRRVILASGMLDATGRLDPSSHKFHVVMITRTGKWVDIHNVEDFYTIAYNNALPLGNPDVIRFEFKVPDLADGAKLRLTARVNFRKFSRPYTEFALGPDARQLPVTVVAEKKIEWTLGPDVMLPEPEADEALAMRLNDFGIANLRQGDTRTANWAFEGVTRMLPKYADGYINIARANLADGAYDDLETVLKKVDEVQPGYYKTAYFLGRLRATQSRFDEAIAAYDVTLAQFPEDREVQNSKGTALFKSERFEDAIKVFEKVLKIDPENLTAQTYLFRCYSSLGDQKKADMYEENYLKYRVEQKENVAVELYRRNYPDGDRECNARHVHPMHAPTDGPPLLAPGPSLAENVRPPDPPDMPYPR